MIMLWSVDQKPFDMFKMSYFIWTVNMVNRTLHVSYLCYWWHRLKWMVNIYNVTSCSCCSCIWNLWVCVTGHRGSNFCNLLHWIWIFHCGFSITRSTSRPSRRKRLAWCGWASESWSPMVCSGCITVCRLLYSGRSGKHSRYTNCYKGGGGYSFWEETLRKVSQFLRSPMESWKYTLLLDLCKWICDSVRKVYGIGQVIEVVGALAVVKCVYYVMNLCYQIVKYVPWWLPQIFRCQCIWQTTKGLILPERLL